MKTYWMMGQQCALEVLKHCPGKIKKILVQKEESDLLPFFKKLPYTLVRKSDLETLLKSESHQGIAIEVSDLNFVSLKEVMEKEGSSKVLMLDHIQDPQNLGALLRAAECFGIDFVIYSKNRSAPLTPVVAKASVGALALLKLVEVSNLSDALLKLQKGDYWSFCADNTSEAKEISTFEFPSRGVLIMGSEGKGLQPTLKAKADFVVKIPMRGKISSLNVSQACSVFLSHWALGV